MSETLEHRRSGAYEQKTKRNLSTGMGAGPRFHGLHSRSVLLATMVRLKQDATRRVAPDCANTAKIEAATRSIHDKRFEFDHAAQHNCNRTRGNVTVSALRAALRK
jgi:hypothetical protein